MLRRAALSSVRTTRAVQRRALHVTPTRSQLQQQQQLPSSDTELDALHAEINARRATWSPEQQQLYEQLRTELVEAHKFDTESHNTLVGTNAGTFPA